LDQHKTKASEILTLTRKYLEGSRNCNAGYWLLSQGGGEISFFSQLLQEGSDATLVGQGQWQIIQQNNIATLHFPSGTKMRIAMKFNPCHLTKETIQLNRSGLIQNDLAYQQLLWICSYCSMDYHPTNKSNV
jgi:hypothetical protein